MQWDGRDVGGEGVNDARVGQVICCEGDVLAGKIGNT